MDGGAAARREIAAHDARSTRSGAQRQAQPGATRVKQPRTALGTLTGSAHTVAKAARIARLRFMNVVAGAVVVRNGSQGRSAVVSEGKKKKRKKRDRCRESSKQSGVNERTGTAGTV